MHVASITSIQALTDSNADLPGSSTRTISFSEVFGRVLERVDLSSTSAQIKDIAGMQQTIERGETFLPRDLILFQVMASRIHLRVELVSKSAETVHATVRRFQQG